MRTRIKYPRTSHLPWSPGVTSDDKIITDLSALEKADNVIVTEKMDGENTTIYNDGSCHARSLESSSHPSRTWMKRMAASWASAFPDNIRVCGENVFAQHSIAYANLHSYFYGFAIWDNDVLLSWAGTAYWFDVLHMTHVPVLYMGKFNVTAIDQAFRDYSANRAVEGYVVRVADRIKAADFSTHVAKFVRSNHVQTDEHWMTKAVIKNKLLRVK